MFAKSLIVLCIATFYVSDAAITSWTTPAISSAADGTGTLTIAESQATSTTITTYVAVTDQSTITYTLGTAVSPFSLTAAGVLTITASLDADTSTSYTLNIVATDNNSGVGTATIAVTVNDIDETPAFTSTSFSQCMAGGSAADTTVITVLATDTDPGDTITHSINSGDTNSDFKIVASTGVIQVNTGKTLTTGSSYTLIIYAADDETTPKTGSTTVSVTVSADCSGAATISVSVIAILMTMLVSVV